MGVLVSPKRPNTPLERTARRAPAEPVIGETPPAVDRIIDPAELPRDLRYQRERAYAVCMSLRFERWLLEHVAQHGIPLDDCLRVVTLLPIYVEAVLKARIVYPGYFPVSEVDEEDEPVDLEWDEDAAAEEGLSVYPPPRPRTLPVPSLPGCHGTGEDGGECRLLRRYGDLFCPSCARKERQRMRAAA